MHFLETSFSFYEPYFYRCKAFEISITIQRSFLQENKKVRRLSLKFYISDREMFGKKRKCFLALFQFLYFISSMWHLIDELAF